MYISEKSSQQHARNKFPLTICVGVTFALCCALTGCAPKTTTSNSPKAFPAPPAVVDSKVNEIQDPALRAKVTADMARMRAAATGNVRPPTKQ